MSANECLRQYHRSLSDLERQELQNFKEPVYYINTTSRACEEQDNERAELICEARQSIFWRYEIQKLVGSGSFGQVWQCLDHRTGQQVALKILRNKRHLYK